MVRGLVLWIGPAVLGSLICTLVFLATVEGGLSQTAIFQAGFAASLWFTLGGSALLLLAFAALRPRRIAVRYAILLALGLGAGAAMMAMFGSLFMAVGAVYGVVTAAAWIVLHRLLYGAV